MENFEYQRKTNLIFGKDNIKKLGTEIKKYTNKKILLTYGGGSIKKIGLYDQVVTELNKEGIEFIELGGIKPNPEVDTARKGIELIKENDIDFILAVGGGSVLDNTKHMAIGSKYEGDVWELVENPQKAYQLKDLPRIGSIITVAATGSEMNIGGVITNPEVNIKTGMFNPECAPVFTIEDPTILYSLPVYQRQAGVSDTLSHLLEVYFAEHEDEMLTDRLVEAIMKTVIANYEGYINDNNYDNSGNIFLSSTFALNGITRLGRGKEDWSSHTIEHEISAYTDLTHGIGLAIIQPKIIRYYLEQDLKNSNKLIKYINLGKNVFDIEEKSEKEMAIKTVDAIEELFYKVANVKKLVDVDVKDFDAKRSINKILKNDKSIGDYINLYEKDLIEIFSRL